MRRLGVLALVTASVVVLTGPVATARTEPPPVWVKGLCGTVADWAAASDVRLGDAAEAMSEDAGAARVALNRTLGRLAKRTHKLVRAIERGGTPDVKGGKAAVRGLAEGFTGLVDGLRAARTRITGAGDDPTAVAATVREAAADLSKLFVQANLDFAELNLASAPLQRAFKKAAACQELVGR